MKKHQNQIERDEEGCHVVASLIRRHQTPCQLSGARRRRSETRLRYAARFWLVAAGFLLSANVSPAQSYSIDWYKVAGGGGMNSTGGVYSISGTIGQHDAGGPMAGGSYSVTGGFWALIAPLQTPGAPTLYISRGTNSVTIFWQAVGSWSLQQNNSVAAPAGWSATSGVTSSGGTNYLTITQPTGKLFFRLMNP